MKRLTWSPPNTPEWQRWLKKGKARSKEHLECLRSGKPIEIDEKLYRRQKKVYRKMSHGLCVYCGVKVSTNQPGDIEHFRPKKSAQTQEFTKVEVDYGDGNGPVKHRGYPWLAYDPQNLLYACASCNRKTKLSKGRTYGKDQRFPVRGLHAHLPEHLDAEEPLLIHPVQDDPAEHIAFDRKTGMLFGLTDRGECTIEVLGLNVRELHEDRIATYDSVKDNVWGLFRAYEHTGGSDSSRGERYAKLLRKVQQGRHEFPQIAQLALEEADAEIAAAKRRFEATKETKGEA